MRKARIGLAAVATLALMCPQLFGQDKPKPESNPPQTTLKLQVTFAEHEGEKKLASLPYTFFVQASEGRNSPMTKVRTGSRIPVYVGKDGGMQYLDVGTNIDARAIDSGEGRYDVSLLLERSWVEGDVLVPAVRVAPSTTEVGAGPFKEPIIRQFKTDLSLAMRDGQTVQTTQAADPLNGRVLTITVTVNVVK